MSDSLSAIYLDGSITPMMAEAISSSSSGGASSRTGRIVPKEEEGRRLNDRYYTFHPDLNRPYPQYGKGNFMSILPLLT